MSGAGFALLAALAYGLAGVAIAKGRATAQADNGVFLSVVLTAGTAAFLWLVWGQVNLNMLTSTGAFGALAAFVAAGVFSMVLGRTTMYRATDLIGPVAVSLMRRLTPVFALPIGIVFLAQIPDARTVFGAILVIAAVVLYIGRPKSAPDKAARLGWMLGVGSAGFYAISYALRGYGLDVLPDAALGTLVGAVTGIVWILGVRLCAPTSRLNARTLFRDRGRWHWITAITLSAGQIFQFLALKSASIVVVATLGSLETLFTALLGRFLIGQSGVGGLRVWGAVIVAMSGVAFIVA